MPSHALTDQQRQDFFDNGYVRLRGCFSPDFAAQLVARAFQRIEMDPADPATWHKQRITAPMAQRWPIAEFAPDAWDAICALCGGVERIDPECHTWGDSLIISLDFKADQPWQPPSTYREGWHKDGYFFRHFLDSPEQGLLAIVLFTDIAPRGGGTFIAPDSIPVVARYLRDHPEGVAPDAWDGLIDQCQRFEEVTGEAGDVFLLHPYMLHAASPNHRHTPRCITNPCFSLTEPMNFNRPDPADFSPVEQAVLHALGVDRLDYRITGQRDHTPDRQPMRSR